VVRRPRHDFYSELRKRGTNQQDARAVLLHAGERRVEAGALIGWGGATNTLIGKQPDQLAGVRLTPREHRAPLRVGIKRLLAGAHAHITNDRSRVAWGS